MTTSVEPNVRFRFKYIRVYMYLFLPFMVAGLSFIFYLLFDLIMNFGSKPTPFQYLSFFIVFILFIIYGIRYRILEMSDTEIDHIGVRKYFLKWNFREVRWEKMRIMVTPNIYYNKKILSFDFSEKSKEKRFLNKSIDFEASSIEIRTLNEVVEVLNYYIQKHQLTVEYGEDKMLVVDQKLDHIPPPPYKWIGQKEKNRMDIDF